MTTQKDPIKKVAPTTDKVVKVKKAKTPTAPLPFVAVRFEADLGKWAVLGDDNSVLESFTHGVMTNVTFESREVSTYVAAQRGCGGSNVTTSFGIAVGQLKKETHGRHSTGFQNLTYTNNRFSDAEGNPLEKVSIVRLMHDRKSLFRA